MWYAKRRQGEHTVLQHTVDTIHVAYELIAAKGYFSRLSQEARQAVSLLVGLHDIGKISEEFQADLGYSEAARLNHIYHTGLTYHLLSENADLIATALGMASKRPLMVLIGAIAGHHGFPVEKPSRGKADQHCGSEALDAARSLISDCLSFFPDASLAELDVKAARRISYQVSGLTSQADWISSAADLFSYGNPTEDMSAYPLVSRAAARSAVATLGFTHTKTTPYPGSTAFTGGNNLRPMQQAASSAEVGRNLYLIEDQTGSGKTEAALDLAARLISSGHANGLYVALPTMALADESGKRIRDLAHLFYENPSMQIVHRNAHMSTVDEADTEMSPNAAHPLGWVTQAIENDHLGDVARKSLFADIGVGTIDQAMLSVMPSRFFALRQHALADKVLIIDEAHEADSYMQEIISQLLWLRGWLGVPTIVMSATLPIGFRDRFINSWNRGAGQSPTLAGDDPGSFPMMTTVTPKSVDHRAVEPFDTERLLPFSPVHSTEDCLGILADAHSRGLNAVWIRNSVDEAIASAHELSAQGLEVTLLHSRFTAPDRARIEAGLKSCIGKSADLSLRRSRARIVIATQVIEAGLDLDFDVMISDLAPMSSLLQRAGRWQRFDIPDRDRRTTQTGLHILTPDLQKVEPGDWLESTLGKGRQVYPQDRLWRTAELLSAHPPVQPHLDTRHLVEASQDVSGVPEWVVALGQQRRRETAGNALKGQRNALLNMRGGYASCYESIVSDARAATRIGPPQLTLTLRIQEGDQSNPLHNDECASQVKIPLYLSGLSEQPEQPMNIVLDETSAGLTGCLNDQILNYSSWSGLSWSRVESVADRQVSEAE